MAPGKEKHSSKFVNAFHLVGRTSLSDDIASGMRRITSGVGLSRTSYIIMYFAWQTGEEVEVGVRCVSANLLASGFTCQLHPKNFLEIISLKSISQYFHFRQFLRGRSPSSLLP